MKATKPSISDILSPRETELARWVSRGFSDKEICVEMGLRPDTVKNHGRSIRDKLGVASRTSVAVFVITGWLPTGASCPTPIAKCK